MENIISIGSYAFRDCTSLTNRLYLPMCGSIDSDAFSGVSIDEIEVGTVNPYFSWRNLNCKRIVANNATSIRGGLMNNNEQYIKELIGTNIVNVLAYMPISVTNFVLGSVKKITDDGFYRCNGLDGIDFSGVTNIGKQAFMQSGIKTANMPLVTKLKTNTFRGSALENAIFDSLDSIDSWCFSGCTSLTNVVMPSLRYMNNELQYPNWCNVFQGCTSLKSVSFDNLLTCKNNCFSGCNSLERVEIPKVYQLFNSFSGCTSLKVIYAPNATVFDATLTGLTSLEEVALKETKSVVANHNYYGARSGCVFHCTDGDVTVP